MGLRMRGRGGRDFGLMGLGSDDTPKWVYGLE